MTEMRTAALALMIFAVVLLAVATNFTPVAWVIVAITAAMAAWGRLNAVERHFDR